MSLFTNLKLRSLVLLFLFLLLLRTEGFSQNSSEKRALRKADYLSLDLKVLKEGNKIDSDGIIRKYTVPIIHLFRTKVRAVKGAIMLLPGGGYGILSANAEGAYTAQFLNEEGFDVALLEYHIASGPKTRDLALSDALKTFRLIKSKSGILGLHEGLTGIMGYSAGGHLAARTVQNLGKDELPDNLILIYPAYLQETIPGTVIKSVMPPKEPTGRLFSVISSNDYNVWVNSCQEYVKMWKGFDGQTSFHLLPQGGHGFGMAKNPSESVQNWTSLLKAFLDSVPAAISTTRIRDNKNQ
jgi:hypothetical protein